MTSFTGKRDLWGAMGMNLLSGYESSEQPLGTPLFASFRFLPVSTHSQDLSTKEQKELLCAWGGYGRHLAFWKLTEDVAFRVAILITFCVAWNLSRNEKRTGRFVECCTMASVFWGDLSLLHHQISSSPTGVPLVGLTDLKLAKLGLKSVKRFALRVNGVPDGCSTGSCHLALAGLSGPAPKPPPPTAGVWKGKNVQGGDVEAKTDVSIWETPTADRILWPLAQLW